MKFKNIKLTQRNKSGAVRNTERWLVQRWNNDTRGKQPAVDYAATQERTRSVLFDCMEFVLLKQYNESPEAFAEYVNTADVILKQYAIISHDMSKVMADTWLSDKLHGAHSVLFMLPVVKYPKGGKERAELDFARQDALVWAKAFCYALKTIGVECGRTGERLCFAVKQERYSAEDIDEIFRLVAKQYREKVSLQRS